MGQVNRYTALIYTHSIVGEYQRRSIDLIARCNDNRGRIGPKTRERFSRMETKVIKSVGARSFLCAQRLTITSVGQDIRMLGQFVEAQKTAFRKILKKYKVFDTTTGHSNKILIYMIEMDWLEQSNSKSSR